MGTERQKERERIIAHLAPAQQLADEQLRPEDTGRSAEAIRRILVGAPGALHGLTEDPDLKRNGALVRKVVGRIFRYKAKIDQNKIELLNETPTKVIKLGEFKSLLREAGVNSRQFKPLSGKEGGFPACISEQTEFLGTIFKGMPTPDNDNVEVRVPLNRETGEVEIENIAEAIKEGILNFPLLHYTPSITEEGSSGDNGISRKGSKGRSTGKSNKYGNIKVDYIDSIDETQYTEEQLIYQKVWKQRMRQSQRARDGRASHTYSTSQEWYEDGLRGMANVDAAALIKNGFHPSIDTDAENTKSIGTTLQDVLRHIPKKREAIGERAGKFELVLVDGDIAKAKKSMRREKFLSRKGMKSYEGKVTAAKAIAEQACLMNPADIMLLAAQHPKFGTKECRMREGIRIIIGGMRNGKMLSAVSDTANYSFGSMHENIERGIQRIEFREEDDAETDDQVVFGCAARF